MEYLLNLIGGDCRDCNRSLVENDCWEGIPTSVRIVIKSDFAGVAARQLCRGCYNVRRATDPDSLLDYPRKTIPEDIFVEEYATLHQSGSTDHQIREVLAMKPKAFEKALYRARKAGKL